MEQTPTPEPAAKQSKIILIVLALIVVVAIAVVTVMIFANQSQAPTTTQNEQTGTTTAPATDAATITFTDDGFLPTTLTVKKGTTVTVVNRSSSSVQFSSGDHPTHREDPEINMSELAPGESGSFTVTVVGTHSFHDHLDDSKTGTLIVEE